MPELSRRAFVGGADATAAALAAPAVHAQRRGGTIQFVAQADLKILESHDGQGVAGDRKTFTFECWRKSFIAPLFWKMTI